MDEKRLSEELQIFAASYRRNARYEAQYQSPADADEARAHILRAEQILLESGVGEAITELFARRRLTWKEYVDKNSSPVQVAEYKTGLDEVGSWDRWMVTIVYNERTYRADINWDSKSKELTSELTIDDIIVAKIGWRGALYSNNYTLYRFKYGVWMKDIVKLHIDIDAFEINERLRQTNERLRAIDNDTMERASRIEF
jgi:hypothetical protein